jgi:predicted MFS family arabinose efflux permease
VLSALTVVSMFSIADRLVLSILIEDIKRDFQFSDSQIGLLTGVAFSLFYVLFGFPFARLADRSTRKNIVAGALAAWSVMTMLCGAATGFWSLFIMRMGVGVGEGASGPASQSLLGDYFRREQLARAMGFLTLGATVGTVTGLIAGGLLADAFGWRLAFVLLGLPGLLHAVLIFTTVREPPRGRYALGGAAEAQQRPLGETIARLLRNKVYLGVVAGFAVQIMIGYALAIWMAPIMLRNFGVSTGTVGLFLGLAFLVGGIPGPIAGGFLTDWLVRRDERWRAWLPGLLGTACLIPLALSLLAGSFWLFLGLFAVAYAIFVATQAPILSLMQLSLDASERAFGVAFALFFNNLIGQALSAAVIGAISDAFKPTLGAASLNLAVFIVCAVSAVIALAIFAWTARQIRLAAV